MAEAAPDFFLIWIWFTAFSSDLDLASLFE
jgi:hypothetical protein